MIYAKSTLILRSASLFNTTFYSVFFYPSIIMVPDILTSAYGGLQRRQKTYLSSYHVFFFFWVKCDISNLNDLRMTKYSQSYTFFMKFILWIHMDLQYPLPFPYYTFVSQLLDTTCVSLCQASTYNITVLPLLHFNISLLTCVTLSSIISFSSNMRLNISTVYILAPRCHLISLHWSYYNFNEYSLSYFYFLQVVLSYFYFT